MAAISIIIPIYNTDVYLHKCVDSVLAQSFSDLEVLLINDGSTGNCSRICEEYAAADIAKVVVA